MSAPRPGSAGEHELQERFDTLKRAAAFYDKQVLDHLNPLMREFIAAQEMAFVATSDAHGECDASFRAGPAGFIRVLDDRTLMYPEYGGNGVMASLGNISENAHVGILFVDFFTSGVGLHVNGRAEILDGDAVNALAPLLARLARVETLHPAVEDPKKTPQRWVLVDVVEAYIHCSKHIPILERVGGDADAPPRPASGDFFKAKHASRPWVIPAAVEADGDELEEEPTPALAEPAPEPVVAEHAVAEPEPVTAEPVFVEAAQPAPSPSELAIAAFRQAFEDPDGEAGTPSFVVTAEELPDDPQPETGFDPAAPTVRLVAWPDRGGVARMFGVRRSRR